MGLIQRFQQEANIATGQSLTLQYDFKDKTATTVYRQERPDKTNQA